MNELDFLRAIVTGLTGDETLPNDPRELRKALTTSAGFLGIQLVDEAKLMLPRFGALRNRIPTGADPQGAATSQWRMQLGYGSFDFAAAFGTANGAVGADTVESATTIAADYKSQSIKGGVQWEAIRQAQGWDNAMTIDTKFALSVLLRLEELAVLYGSGAALTMSAVSGDPSTLSDDNTFSNAVWSVAVTAITGIGTVANAAANSTTGETLLSSDDISVGAGAADFLDVSWPAVPGALGYKVYCNAVGGGGSARTALYLCDPNTDLAYAKLSGGSYLAALGDSIVVPAGQTYVTVNHVQIIAVPPNTQPNPPATDGSANANMFEGVNSWCTKSTIYGTALPYRQVIDMAGLPLTSQSTGVAEIDLILEAQWATNHISPTLIITSPKGVVSIANRIAAAGNGSQIRLDVYQDRNAIVGGLYIGGYVNKFASGLAGMQTTIDVWAHPYMPDGTFLLVAEDLPPETYPYSGVGKTFDLDVATPYTYLPLGRTDRSFPYTVFYNETMRCYWPNAMSAIVGARVDS